MKSIDVFYQGEGVGEIAHLELEPEATFATLKAHLAEKHGVANSQKCPALVGRCRVSSGQQPGSARTDKRS